MKKPSTRRGSGGRARDPGSWALRAVSKACSAYAPEQRSDQRTYVPPRQRLPLRDDGRSSPPLSQRKSVRRLTGAGDPPHAQPVAVVGQRKAQSVATEVGGER